MRNRVLLGIVAVCVLLGCHRQSTEQNSPIRSVRNVIAQDEIDAAEATNVYDLIARVRGSFLRDRGKVSLKMNQREKAVVFMNDQEYGILETMRNIPCGRIGEIRYFPGTEAVSKFGSQYGGGVIQLISRTY